MFTEHEKTLLHNTLVEVANLIKRDEPLNRNDFSNDDLNVLYSLAYGLYQAGDYAQAKEIFHQLVLSKPFKKDYWMGLGASCQLEKNYMEALKAWSMVALLDDKDPTPHFHAAECYFSDANPEEAFKALSAAKDRLSVSDTDLKHKINGLEAGWTKEEQQGA